jgi:hypothetical protein
MKKFGEERAEYTLLLDFDASEAPGILPHKQIAYFVGPKDAHQG